MKEQLVNSESEVALNPDLKQQLIKNYFDLAVDSMRAGLGIDKVKAQTLTAHTNGFGAVLDYMGLTNEREQARQEAWQTVLCTWSG